MNQLATSDELGAVLRTDFLGFVHRTFNTLNPGRTLVESWHLEAISYQLEQVRTGTITRLAIALPPRSLKSMMVSIAYPAYLLGLDPTRRMICLSYSQKLAEALARDFRTVVNADWYQRTFPETRTGKDTAEEFVTTRGGLRLATSIGGTLTGRGGNLIIIDDPLNAEEATSAAERDRTNEFYRSSVLTRLDDKVSGAIILVMQRLHDQDLFGTVTRQSGYTKLVLPAIAPCEERIQIGEGRWHSRSVGDVLDPRREPLHVLEDLKRAKGSVQFQAQYQQAPAPEGGNMIRKDWLKTYDRSPLPRRPGDQIVQSWDTAMKSGERNDFSVCTTWLIREGVCYLLEVTRKHRDYPALVRLAHDLHQTYRPDTVLIEDHGTGTALIQDLKQNYQIASIPIRPEKDKETRLSTVSPLIEEGSVCLPAEAPWLGEFLDELLRFPQARFDDQVDSLSQFLNWVRERRWSKSVFEYDFGLDESETSPHPHSLRSLLGAWR